MGVGYGFGQKNKKDSVVCQYNDKVFQCCIAFRIYSVETVFLI